ncbi:hypothetical protein D9M70_648210 [compost metagenome]
MISSELAPQPRASRPKIAQRKAIRTKSRSPIQASGRDGASASASREKMPIPSTMVPRPMSRIRPARSPVTRKISSAVKTGISPGEMIDECSAGAKEVPPTRIRL